MKKYILFHLAALSVGAMLFSSCSSSKQTAFSKAKYYNFGHHDPVVVLNQNTNKSAKQSTGEALQNTEFVAQSLQVEKSKKTTLPIRNSPVQKIERQMHSLSYTAGQPTSKNNDVKTGCEGKSEVYPAYMPVYANEMAPTATTSGGGNSSIDPVVLIVLAIFISPLAVYLYDNAATGRFWLDLVLWVLGIGFLGLFYYIGLLWLIAVIYAILIVTGHA